MREQQNTKPASKTLRDCTSSLLPQTKPNRAAMNDRLIGRNSVGSISVEGSVAEMDAAFADEVLELLCSSKDITADGPSTDTCTTVSETVIGPSLLQDEPSIDAENTNTNIPLATRIVNEGAVVSDSTEQTHSTHSSSNDQHESASSVATLSSARVSESSVVVQATYKDTNGQQFKVDKIRRHVQPHHATIGDSHGNTVASETLRQVREDYQASVKNPRSKVTAKREYRKYWDRFVRSFHQKTNNSFPMPILLIRNVPKGEHEQLVQTDHQFGYQYEGRESVFELAKQTEAFIDFLSRNATPTPQKTLRLYREKFAVLQDAYPDPTKAVEAKMKQFQYMLWLFEGQLQSQSHDEEMAVAFQKQFSRILAEQWKFLPKLPPKDGPPLQTLAGTDDEDDMNDCNRKSKKRPRTTNAKLNGRSRGTQSTSRATGSAASGSKQVRSIPADDSANSYEAAELDYFLNLQSHLSSLPLTAAEIAEGRMNDSSQLQDGSEDWSHRDRFIGGDRFKDDTIIGQMTSPPSAPVAQATRLLTTEFPQQALPKQPAISDSLPSYKHQVLPHPSETTILAEAVELAAGTLEQVQTQTVCPGDSRACQTATQRVLDTEAGSCSEEGGVERFRERVTDTDAGRVLGRDKLGVKMPSAKQTPTLEQSSVSDGRSKPKRNSRIRRLFRFGRARPSRSHCHSTGSSQKCSEERNGKWKKSSSSKSHSRTIVIDSKLDSRKQMETGKGTVGCSFNEQVAPVASLASLSDRLRVEGSNANRSNTRAIPEHLRGSPSRKPPASGLALHEDLHRDPEDAPEVKPMSRHEEDILLIKARIARSRPILCKTTDPPDEDDLSVFSDETKETAAISSSGRTCISSYDSTRSNDALEDVRHHLHCLSLVRPGDVLLDSTRHTAKLDETI